MCLTVPQGPYDYELFSIMIHSGSAAGGHYYAYIKWVIMYKIYKDIMIHSGSAAGGHLL